jgi:hypothetical protein
MIKYYCDCCLKEADHLYSFDYYCHLDDVVNHKIDGYVDKNMNPVSRRMDEHNFCLKCYNIIVSKAVQEFYNRMVKR